MSSSSHATSAEHLLWAVYSAPQRRIDEIVGKLYAAHLAGLITEDQADNLHTAAQHRRDVLRVRRKLNAQPESPARPQTHDRSRLRGSRRKWSGSGALPPSLRSAFTPGENAVAAVIRAEVKKHGTCTLTYGQIATSAGLLSTTVVKRFIREAKKMKLIAVKERRVAGGKNKPNVITITSTEWKRWNDLSRGEGSGGTTVPPY